MIITYNQFKYYFKVYLSITTTNANKNFIYD